MSSVKALVLVFVGALVGRVAAVPTVDPVQMCRCIDLQRNSLFTDCPFVCSGGGAGWVGPTTCPAGFYCSKLNDCRLMQLQLCIAEYLTYLSRRQPLRSGSHYHYPDLDKARCHAAPVPHTLMTVIDWISKPKTRCSIVSLSPNTLVATTGLKAESSQRVAEESLADDKRPALDRSSPPTSAIY